jgi:hypothetical protein
MVGSVGRTVGTDVGDIMGVPVASGNGLGRIAVTGGPTGATYAARRPGATDVGVPPGSRGATLGLK